MFVLLGVACVGVGGDIFLEVGLGVVLDDDMFMLVVVDIDVVMFAMMGFSVGVGVVIDVDIFVTLVVVEAVCCDVGVNTAVDEGEGLVILDETGPSDTDEVFVLGITVVLVTFSEGLIVVLMLVLVSTLLVMPAWETVSLLVTTTLPSEVVTLTVTVTFSLDSLVTVTFPCGSAVTETFSTIASVTVMFPFTGVVSLLMELTVVVFRVSCVFPSDIM